MPVFEAGALQKCVGNNDPDAGQNTKCGESDGGTCSRSIGGAPTKRTGEEEDGDWNLSDEAHSHCETRVQGTRGGDNPSKVFLNSGCGGFVCDCGVIAG